MRIHWRAGTVHPRSPTLAEQQKDRGDQRTGVTDTDPPYEVGDIPSPANRFIEVPLAGTKPDFPGHGDNTEK